MNRVVPNFTCPLAPPDAGYNTAVLSDNSVFTYRIVWTLADKVTAETACVTDGAGLVKVLSLTKMQTLVNLFTTCPGYVYAGDYWIDGSNINAADFFDIAEWSTSDSEPLPTTDQFWAPERPLDPDIHHCVALWAADDYQWANLPCTYTNYYICEK
ncbi:type-2 ice-structuring protein-like [Mercenaria mercenaria]|uniref:type-2 ice-structuring protein-like n=1 Tax=Mercenaria mercenaria TaxID=6596 RepID=UPI001E1D56A3|nr:type-2 ice-structuring protein-like [Mercenaria mercenaria]